METKDLIWVVGIAITIVWIVTMMAGVFADQYEPMQISTPVMVIFAGFLFARGGFNKNGHGGKEE